MESGSLGRLGKRPCGCGAAANQVESAGGFLWLGIDLQNWMAGWWFETFYIFPFSRECHHPNWRTYIFQRGRAQPPTRWWLIMNWMGFRFLMGFGDLVGCYQEWWCLMVDFGSGSEPRSSLCGDRVFEAYDSLVGSIDQGNFCFFGVIFLEVSRIRVFLFNDLSKKIMGFNGV